MSWKYKVGEPFSAGDVILEVETDKSQIDVEALDDGKLAKILKDEGSKDVDVGEPIAYIADVDDDLATIKLPQEANTANAKSIEIKKPSADRTEATQQHLKKPQLHQSKPLTAAKPILNRRYYHPCHYYWLRTIYPKKRL